MFQTYTQFVKTSLQALLANKVRSFLTMWGIIIGVGAVILIVSVGAGAQSLIVDQVKTLGTDLIAILPGKVEDDGPPASAMGIVITTLKYDDAQALSERKNVPNLKAVAAYSTGTANTSWESHNYSANLSGTTI